jgi:hypothetical protein
MLRVVTLIALACAAAPAWASEVGVVSAGDPALQSQVATRFASWLRTHGHTVVEQPLSLDAANTLTNCFTLDDLACARGVFEAQSKTDRLVFVRSVVTGRNVTFDVYWFVRGKDAIGERRICQKCEEHAWYGLTDKMLDRLVGNRLTTRRTEERPSRLGPAILLGAGIATIAAGGIFLYYGSRDGGDQKYIYPDSTPIGIALAAVGAGGTIGGTIWLIQVGSTRSGPVASATRGGAYLGWAGHF